jgi:hypothetical protein
MGKGDKKTKKGKKSKKTSKEKTGMKSRDTNLKGSKMESKGSKSLNQHKEDIVLELSADQAMAYFLQPSSYTTIVFPKYFDFKKILEYAKAKIGDEDFKSCLKDPKLFPSCCDKVSYHILMNKDGRYAYRPLQLVNPYLYYFLVREITKPDNWHFLQSRFNDFKNDKCEVISIPSIKGAKDKSITATTIRSWWENIEQRSIELSLEYRYLFVTDITNCYSSIYTHSISWALYGIDYAKGHREEHNLGKSIDTYIMGMQYGQTNGIPQGSILFDFIAEIVLGYADLLLYKALEDDHIADYRILRYRDDYRIFSNNKEEIEVIAMKLQAILSTLNLQLNSSKTELSEDLVEASIKKDKLYYLANVPIYKGNTTLFNTFQQELLFILQFSKKYPNSGTLSKLLNKFLKRIESKGDKLDEDANILAAITVEIAMNSPKIYSLIVSILSHLITRLETTAEREQMVKNVYNKFSRLPNIGYLQIWMQRITYKMAEPLYTEPLCKIVKKEPAISIWNNNWLKDEFISDFPTYSMCTEWLVKSFTPIIDIDEVSIFDY